MSSPLENTDGKLASLSDDLRDLIDGYDVKVHECMCLVLWEDEYGVWHHTIAATEANTTQARQALLSDAMDKIGTGRK